MMREPDDVPRTLPLVTPHQADELLSSWLSRIARDYYIPPRSLLTHMGLAVPSVERLDLTLAFAQAIVISGFVRRSPDVIMGMTHARIPADCHRLVRLTRPQQVCRACAGRHKQGSAGGAVLRSWMQGWRITCRACGSPLDDVWGDPDRPAPKPFAAYENRAKAGEDVIEAYATGRQAFEVSPATMLRLLWLRRMPEPSEFNEAPRRPRRLIDTIIPRFDTAADAHGLNGAIGKTLVFPLATRVALLAALAIVMDDPLDALRRFRGMRIPIFRFDAILAKDPIVSPAQIPKSRLT